MSDLSTGGVCGKKDITLTYSRAIRKYFEHEIFFICLRIKVTIHNCFYLIHWQWPNDRYIFEARLQLWNSCYGVYIFSCRFICKNNGVLFENDLLQIGVKSEYRQNLGRLGIFYGNKTSFQFSGFSIDTQCPGELGSHILYKQSHFL